MAFATLAVDFLAKFASFEEGMAKASKSVEGLDKKFGAIGATVNKALGTFGIALGAGAIVSYAKGVVDVADGLQDMSDRLGITVKDLASFQLAAKLSDTSLEGVGRAIQKLSLSIGQAESGMEVQAEALKLLGITARDPKEAFFQLADAVANSNDPIKTNAALNDVLGRSYGELLPLLKQGSAALRESARQSETFAETMARLSPDAGKFNDELDKLKQNAAGASASILSNLVPALDLILERFNTFAQYKNANFFDLFGSLSGRTTTDLRNINKEISGLESTIARLRKNSGGIDSSIGPLTAELTRLKALRAEAIDREVARLMAPPKSDGNSSSGDNAEQIACIASGGVWDGKKCRPKSSAAKGPDLESMRADDIAEAWKQADEELKQYADDRAFVMQGDLQRDNAINAIAQEWKDAGAALKQDMLTPLEKFNNRLEYIDELWLRGAIDVETYNRATAAAFDDNAPKIEKTKTLAEELGLTFESSFENALVGGKKVSDMLKGLAQDMLRIVARKAITEPLANAVGKFAANLFPSANGNAFLNAPALSAYSGSVVSRPTVFPFASGIGLMGEAGPEAILPLKRGRGGKLGVAMDGGGGYVDNRVYNIDARGADAGVEQRIRRAIAESEDRAVDRSVGQVQNLNQRGQLRLS